MMNLKEWDIIREKMDFSKLRIHHGYRISIEQRKGYFLTERAAVFKVKGNLFHSY